MLGGDELFASLELATFIAGLQGEVEYLKVSLERSYTQHPKSTRLELPTSNLRDKLGILPDHHQPLI